MSTRMKVAFGCYAAAYLLFAAFAAIYLLRPRFMPYHAVAVGMQWEEVGRPFQILILGLMRVVGGGLLGAAFIGAVLLVWPFRQGAPWARWAIPAHGLIFEILILGLMRVVGGGLLGAAFIGAVLLVWPFRQGAPWARWAIPAHGLIV